MSGPIFTGEGPQFYNAAYAQYSPYATPGAYTTKLTPAQEKQFRKWVARNGVPFDPNAKVADYDMRGYWKAANAHPKWKPGSGQHFPDTFKTPYDTTFSGESKYAVPGTPLKWVGDKLVNTKTGQVMYAPPKVKRAQAMPAGRPQAAAQAGWAAILGQLGGPQRPGGF